LAIVSYSFRFGIVKGILFILALLLSITSNVIAQKSCKFVIANDTTICNPDSLKLSVSGSNLDKVKWYGSNIISNDTLDEITVQLDSTTTFHVINRIPDPVNLIVNGDFEMGNVGFQSDYFLSCTNGMMPQGSYCINNVTDIYWPAWKPCSDHTTGTGNLYVTDGAIITDEKIWCQTVNVTPNTDYEFSAWLTSVLNKANAKLQFTINTAPIGSPFEASSNECEWNEFFQIWNSGVSTSADICITNQNTASDGNDFALDDIKFNKVCYSYDSITVTVQPEITVEINEDTTICPGDNFTIKPNHSYPSYYTYTWNSGETTSSIINSKIGEFSIVVSSPEGCFATDTMEVKRIIDPTSNLIEDTTICFTIFNELNLFAGSANYVIWNHPNGTDTAENFKATQPGTHQVTLYNGNNCFTTDRVEIEEFCSTELFIPNSFTPNNDGINDTFGASSEEAYSYNLLIFNRWGKVVFTSSSLNNRWNGNKAPQGTYSYLATYTLANREGGFLEETKKIGNVVLIR
jgi:gliding motility-associated-like protein